jgi:prevent-host-death family protein
MHVSSYFGMKTVNALELRQSLGRVLRALEKGGEPILIERQRQPAAVLISLEDYRRRFADRDADEERRAIIARIRGLRFSSPSSGTTVDLLRNLRS